MKKLYFLVVTIFMVTLLFGQNDVFINEIHYSNSGVDINEGIEIAGPSGTDLAGWQIVFYNGSDGGVLSTQTLSGIIPNFKNNKGVIWFDKTGLDMQNGPDGIALIDPLSNVIQFLSYEGSFTAIDGAANGITSTDILVSEDGADASGNSLQLTGTGVNYEDFIWASAATSTYSSKNNGQTFSIAPAIINNNYKITGLDYEVSSGPSIEGTFVVEGTNLTEDIFINAPSNFEISETSGGVFNTSITLLKGAGTTVAPTTIYVRLKSGLTIGSYNQNVICTSTNAVSKTSLLSGIVSPSAGSIIITEIMPDPNTVDDDEGEYFEVYNTTASNIDMQGWVISDTGLESHTINSSVIVPSGGYAVLARNSDIGVNGGFAANYNFAGFILRNDSDEIILTSGVTEIDRVEYNDTSFPVKPGKSMELSLTDYNSIDNNIESNWGEATTTYGDGDFGTPGSENIFTLSVVKNQIEDFIMYPNPIFNENLYISSANDVPKSVQIFTINGQQVYNKTLQFEKKLNVSKLTKGIYFVKVKEEGKIATRKLIIN